MMHHCQITCSRVVFMEKATKKKRHYPVARQGPGEFQQCTIPRNDLKELCFPVEGNTYTSSMLAGMMFEICQDS